MQEIAVEKDSAGEVDTPKGGLWHSRLGLGARLKASGVHFGLSLLVFMLTVVVLVAAWYPPPFYRTDGLLQGLRIAVLVDLVLGPLLTLVVFRHGKAGLKFDLACIATLQVIALVYGVCTIYSQRPFFNVFADGQFYTVRWGDVAKQGRSATELQALHDRGSYRPPMVIVPPPKDALEGLERELGMLMGAEKSIQWQAKLYKLPDPELWPFVMENRLSEKQIKTNKILQLKLDQLAAQQKMAVSTLAAFKLSGRFEDAWIVLDQKDGRLIGYFD